MKALSTSTLRNGIALCLLATSLMACSMFEGREKPSEYADDTGISSKIKADIVADSKLSIMQINVETMQGVVQLSGFVDSAQSEARAVNIARQVHGVKSVKDDLVIR